MNLGISDSISTDSQNSEILFFTARLDERGRIIVPAPIRKKLRICLGSAVFVGIEKASEDGWARDALDRDNNGNSGGSADSNKDSADDSDCDVPENKKGVKTMCSSSSAFYDARFGKSNPFEEERQTSFERVNQYGSDLAPPIEESESGSEAESQRIRFETDKYRVLQDFRVIFKR